MKPKDLGLERTLKESELKNISIDLLEAGLDSILNDGMIKDIPVIGIVYGLTKTGLNIKDRIFLKKIFRLLYETKSIPIEKRKQEIEKLNNDTTYKLSVGEKLIFILDKSDDLEKVQYISRLFAKLLNEEISYEDFLRCSDAIIKLFTEDLKWFLTRWSDNGTAGKYHHRLFSAGIFELKFRDLSSQHGYSGGSPMSYAVSKVGKKIHLHLGER